MLTPCPPVRPSLPAPDAEAAHATPPPLRLPLSISPKGTYASRPCDRNRAHLTSISRSTYKVTTPLMYVCISPCILLPLTRVPPQRLLLHAVHRRCAQRAHAARRRELRRDGGHRCVPRSHPTRTLRTRRDAWSGHDRVPSAEYVLFLAQTRTRTSRAAAGRSGMSTRTTSSGACATSSSTCARCPRARPQRASTGRSRKLHLS